MSKTLLKIVGNMQLTLYGKWKKKCVKKVFDHDSKNPGILGLERKILEVASYANLNQAVFYMLPIEVTHQNDPKLYKR